MRFVSLFMISVLKHLIHSSNKYLLHTYYMPANITVTNQKVAAYILVYIWSLADHVVISVSKEKWSRVYWSAQAAIRYIGLVAYTTSIDFLTVLEARRPRSSCYQGWFLVRLFLLACKWPTSLSHILTQPLLCGKRELWWVFFFL